jgi:hypothetical protein
MAKKSRKNDLHRIKHPMEAPGLHGFYRVAIKDPDGTIVGDSGWGHNIITNVGISDYIAKRFIGAAGSAIVAQIALGSATQSASAFTASTSLPGQIAGSHMVAIGANTAYTSRAASSDGETIRILGTFSSNIFENSTTIACAGLHSATNGSVFCMGTFASSTVATNQAINLTYDVVFLGSSS